MIHMIDMRRRHKLVTFLGQILPHMQWLRIIHIAHDTYDTHETETRVGHIFGEMFGTHADVTYNTYCTGVTFLIQFLLATPANFIYTRPRCREEIPWSKCMQPLPPQCAGTILENEPDIPCHHLVPKSLTQETSDVDSTSIPLWPNA